MSSAHSLTQGASTRRRAVIVSVCLSLGLWCWLEGRALASAESSHGNLIAQVEHMAVDAGAIAALRTAPRQATEQKRPNDELLDEVRDSLKAASIPLERWVGNDPSLPVRVPKTPYKRFTVRLMFEDVTLRDLVRFAHHLTAVDPALSISNLRIHAPRESDTRVWNVDMSLSYLIYAPYQNPRSLR